MDKKGEAKAQSAEANDGVRGPASPRLKRAMHGLDPAVEFFVVEEELQSHTVVANGWDSAEEFATEWWDRAPQGDLLTLWNRAEAMCKASVFKKSKASDDMVAVRAASVAPPSSNYVSQIPGNVAKSRLKLAFVPDAAKINARKRMRPPKEGENVESQTMTDNSAAILVAEDLWRIVIQCGDASKVFQEFRNVTHKETRADIKDLFVDQACCVSLQGLKQGRSTWNRWAAYCKQADLSPVKASRTQVALWLKKLKENGKTAPRGALTALKMVCGLLGLDLALEDKVVRAQTLCARAQEEIPAEPFRVKVWLLFEKELWSDNGFVRALSLAWVLLITGVMRFAHLQRSRYVDTKENVVTFKATSGKAKCEGVRKPMWWCAPRLLADGGDLLSHVSKYLAERGDVFSEADFWLPNFTPNRAQLDGVSGLGTSRMTIHKFQKLTAEFLTAKGVPKEQVDQFTTYSARRVLPTVADAANMTPTERINVGAWKDPKGRLSRTKEKLTMPDRYADKLLRSKARAKCKVILAVKEALKKLDVDKDPEWETVFKFLPRSKALEESVRECF